MRSGTCLMKYIVQKRRQKSKLPILVQNDRFYGRNIQSCCEARGKTFKSEKQMQMDMEEVVLRVCFEE